MIAKTALCAFSIFCCPRPQTLMDNYHCRRDLEQLMGLNEELRRDIVEIDHELDRMDNVEYLSHVIRDELGYARRGELTMVLE